ncbi:DUF5362 domain-containing protein [Halomonas sp. ISL-60]|uniref:DUF5362 family protein n=1 Tax=Halomonas sp. ISL-56 TaxID=2819149 RepID=UPI001BE73162|nr:DUF5362 family protein [Halomonas sp. ISL-56]MBT2772146.1 DUF5362 domain-containing protein [Halomonas sp. ISL-60]MBT2803757.1 DUF5362 domain-containing protein [Halomonas sp. ISL-56]
MEQQELLKDVIEPIYRAKFWMQLTGVMLIISGILSAISIVGIIVAWIPVWAGIVLMQSAKAANKAFQSGDARETKFALEKIKTHFTIFGVLILIYLAIFVGAMLFGAIGFGSMMMSY